MVIWASFSVTTAATDLATFITQNLRMELLPPYGVVSTSGARVDEFFYMSRWGSNFGEFGDAFLSLCEDDVSCKSRFDSKGVNGTLQQLIEEFDHDPNSTCAALVSSTFEAGESASFRLRSALGSALMDSIVRTLIPPVVYRLQRCAPDDLDILKQFFLAVSQANNAKTEDSALQSNLLQSLIVYSEMMERPLLS
ncbi:uncharacterized protein PITG_22444 [Phytophthora infestans T30-4]|uniref:Uncharacterized protein n=1 Tax=Phytophthora infestans (strain T30-4) TaxID=403677 RepID=D0RMC1_PHYIT|nr:uncharacterized protein PITG_22444 [Phytophthora infestans T30-4]EEY62039.1 conserved hypothetical protein [Phytophthora infestans T30-4]|eukprot:XP_002909809.1 conserved hypothetical protein [Phytophthora infestans T30-4]